MPLFRKGEYSFWISTLLLKVETEEGNLKGKKGGNERNESGEPLMCPVHLDVHTHITAFNLHNNGKRQIFYPSRSYFPYPSSSSCQSPLHVINIKMLDTYFAFR